MSGAHGVHSQISWEQIGYVQVRRDTLLQKQRKPSEYFGNMNEQARACLRKAEECEHSAQRTTDENTRLLYLDLANHWRTLAEHVETMHRQPAGFEQSKPNTESN
jgi:hypothetical protein